MTQTTPNRSCGIVVDYNFTFNPATKEDAKGAPVLLRIGTPSFLPSSSGGKPDFPKPLKDITIKVEAGTETLSLVPTKYNSDSGKLQGTFVTLGAKAFEAVDIAPDALHKFVRAFLAGDATVRILRKGQEIISFPVSSKSYSQQRATAEDYLALVFNEVPKGKCAIREVPPAPKIRVYNAQVDKQGRKYCENPSNNVDRLTSIGGGKGLYNLVSPLPGQRPMRDGRKNLLTVGSQQQLFLNSEAALPAASEFNER